MIKKKRSSKDEVMAKRYAMISLISFLVLNTAKIISDIYCTLVLKLPNSVMVVPETTAVLFVVATILLPLICVTLKYAKRASMKRLILAAKIVLFIIVVWCIMGIVWLLSVVW